MDGEPPAVHVVRLITQEIEKLCVQDAHDKVEGVVGIGDDNEQRRFPVADGVQLHLVRFHQFPQLFDVKGGKAGTAGDEDGFCSLAKH